MEVLWWIPVFNFRSVGNDLFTSLLFSQAINPCSRKVCDPNADCIYLGPNQHKCTCGEGYTGDGQICLPIDPCQAAHGSCPAHSSICIYDGPGKVSVTAQEEIMLYLQKEPMRVWKQLPRKSNAIPSFTISRAVDQEGVLLTPLKTGMTIVLFLLGLSWLWFASPKWRHQNKSLPVKFCLCDTGKL